MSDNHIRHFNSVLPMREPDPQVASLPEESNNADDTTSIQPALRWWLILRELKSMKDNQERITRDIARVEGKLDKIFHIVSSLVEPPAI